MAHESQGESFWSRRWEALLDNLIWYVVFAAIVALIGIAAAFGTDEATLPLWVVVLFAVVQAASVVAILGLFRRLSALTATLQPAAPPRHPHHQLLARIDALDSSLSELQPALPADWPAAAAFNGILTAARSASRGFTLHEIEPLERGSGDFASMAYEASNGTVRTLLGQIRSILASEHP